MDQKSLYAVFTEAGCRILSFEDYPECGGSWRASFMLRGLSCEVISNRRDSYLIFRSTSTSKNFRKIVECKNIHDDKFDLASIENWFTFAFE